MTDKIETIRNALNDAMVWAPSKWSNEAPCRIRDALAALDTITAEITTLRANALDLSAVPEGWLFESIVRVKKYFECDLVRPIGSFLISGDREVYGTGPTPSAALSSAIERAKQSTGE